MEPPDVVVRRALDSDATAIAGVWLRAFTTALPTVHRAHSDDQVHTWIRNLVVPHHETWAAIADGSVVGVLALDGDDLDQLYVDPHWQGQGIGDRLVELAKHRRPEGLALWTFHIDRPARRFYERRGFLAAEFTDGHRNQEREPDVRYLWRPSE